MDRILFVIVDSEVSSALYGLLRETNSSGDVSKSDEVFLLKSPVILTVEGNHTLILFVSFHLDVVEGKAVELVARGHAVLYLINHITGEVVSLVSVKG